MTNPIAEATIIQRRSARPDQSVALRASAGSGKTKVLVDRFLRLCIEAGAHPRAILAVTFTRKAAVEIQERLLSRARKLALADDAALTKELTSLFEGRDKPAPTAAEKNAAANLLEKILEDVSGLNVGTIHAFCQLILGRFAAEAGLDPHFTVLENQDDLIDEALEELEKEMASDPAMRAAVAIVGPKPSSVRAALRGIFPEQMRLGRWLAVHPAAPCRLNKLPDLLTDLKAFLFPDLPLAGEPEATDFLPLLADELEAFAGPGGEAIAAEMGADLATVKPEKLQKLRDDAAHVADQLRDLGAGGDIDRSTFDTLVADAKKIFLTAKNETRSFTAIRKDVGLKERFNALVSTQALGVLGVLHRLGYIELYQQNQARLQLTLRLFDIYDGLKKRDRVVDFQDLEDMACRLMGDEGSVGALLFRLDDSLSHILLDEFQDTNFNQWDMLKPFVDEFLSTTTDGGARTLFFVGDVKQSIYGFRGAEPSIFTTACDLLKKHDLNVESLPTNFRSLKQVVDGVGCLFQADPLKNTLSAEERQNVHQKWARGEADGQVLFLAPFAAAEADEADPGAEVDERSGDQLAAQATAQLVRQMKEDTAHGTWDGFGANLTPRPLRWSDFLILSRTRTEISLYEKAFRNENIPFVPPGRGMLAASREVQDILALLRWLLWPDDDAALATVLRSPLFRMQEKPFQELLAARGLLKPGEKEGRFRTPANLWPALKKKEGQEPYTRPTALLREWRKHLGFETCHDLLRRIFREGEVLERYQVARGDQARYNLLRLYDLALSPEISGTPTVRQLADFIGIAAGRGGQDEGALPRDGGEGRVQFMTVHGAKGLEAPVVFLVDANRPAGKESPRVRVQAESPDTPLLFKVNKAYRDGFKLPENVSWPQDPLQKASAKARERDLAEEANLLYVAMTRARDRLVVVGSHRETGNENDSPMRKIATGLMADGCAAHVQTDDPAGLTRPPVATTPPAATVPTGVADISRTWQPPPPREIMKVITPSGVPDDTDHDPDERTLLSAGPRVQQDEIDPTERGHQVHLMLQLAADHGALPAGSGAHFDEAATVFGDQGLSWVFRPQDEGGHGLCEVPVIHRRTPESGKATEERITGIIDRLVVRPGRVDIVDYKTNRFGGDAAVRANLVRHYRPQLATYGEVVARLYPDHAIHTWLLFTEPGLPSDQRLEEVAAP